MQIRTFWKAREHTRKTMLIFAHQPQYSVIFVGRKLGRFGVPGFCVVCLLCLSTRPWGGPPRSGASQGLGIGNIMLVMQGKPNFQRITGATCAPPRPHRPPPWLDPDPPCSIDSRGFTERLLSGEKPVVLSCLVLSCLLTLYTAVMSFEILFPFGLWVSEPGWLLSRWSRCTRVPNVPLLLARPTP